MRRLRPAQVQALTRDAHPSSRSWSSLRCDPPCCCLSAVAPADCRARSLPTLLSRGLGPRRGGELEGEIAPRDLPGARGEEDRGLGLENPALEPGAVRARLEGKHDRDRAG